MPDPLHLLLDIQDRDIAADQLRHRRASLPERGSLAEREDTSKGIEVEVAELRDRLADVQRAQKRLEDEVATVAAKRAAENSRLYSGTVTSPRELQAMQEEIDALARRQRELEDELLEVMEQAEPMAAQVEVLDARLAVLATERADLRTAIADAEGVIDDQLALAAAARAAVAAEVPTDLIDTYERLRVRLGGVAVARLDGGQCTGCHLSLPATEVDAVRHAGPSTMVFHEECGRILVR